MSRFVREVADPDLGLLRLNHFTVGRGRRLYSAVQGNWRHPKQVLAVGYVIILVHDVL